VFFSIGTPTIARWNERDREYQDLARELNTRAADADVVMVVDPPSFYNAAHRRAIMIPTESTDALFLAAQKYGARWLVLQFDHPRTLSDLYHQRATVPGLTLVATFQDALKRPVFLYQFER
jgi:hypothetical protein